MKNGILKYIVTALLCIALITPQVALAQAASQSPLINQSSIQFIPTGGSATFGFTIGGTIPRKILIRAIGPGLAQLGVSDTMPDPRCDIFRNGAGQIFGNDDWGLQNSLPPGSVVIARAAAAELPAIMASVGAFGPLSSNDAAVVITLPPGSYTARASSGNSSVGTSGNVIIEVYLVE